jgi:hypothetical protein
MSNRRARIARKEEKRSDRVMAAVSAYLDSVTEESYSPHDSWVVMATATHGEAWVSKNIDRCVCCHHGDGSPRINGEAWEPVNPRDAK